MGPSAMEGMAGMAEDDITRKIKVEAPNFDGRLELSTIGSLIWITILPGMKCQEHCRVWFAKMKLVGQVKTYWTNIESKLRVQAMNHWVLGWNEREAEREASTYDIQGPFDGWVNPLQQNSVEV